MLLQTITADTNTGCKLKVQSCTTLTDMWLMEYMGLTEKDATIELFI